MLEPTRINVLIVDDHHALAYGTKLFLESFSWIEIVEVATSGSSAIAAMEGLKPNVIILDLHLNDMSGVTLVDEIRKSCDAHIVIYTGDDEWAEYINQLREFHISGFVHKKYPLKFLEQSIKGALCGYVLIPFDVFQFLSYVGDNSVDPGFTMREISILKRLSEGLTNKEIAHELYLSPKTIENSLTRIYKKLGVESRSKAIKRFKELY